MPGVVAVWTHADIAGLPPIDFRDPAAEALKPYRQPLLARDRVRYVGEPVAAVFAETAALAEDAAELVALDLEELPARLDASAPPGEFAPGVGTEALVLHQEYGDVDAAFRAAHCVVEADLSVGRHTGVPLECRGALGRYDAAYDIVELWGAAKVPHRNREALARFLDRPAGVGAASRRPCRRRSSAYAASSTPRTSWSASRACALGGRSSGSRIASNT